MMPVKKISNTRMNWIVFLPLFVSTMKPMIAVMELMKIIVSGFLLFAIVWTELLLFYLISGWDSDMCDNPSFSHIQGCRINKGKPIDVSNLMHRKY